jgi:hypothetical protein
MNTMTSHLNSIRVDYIVRRTFKEGEVFGGEVYCFDESCMAVILAITREIPQVLTTEDEQKLAKRALEHMLENSHKPGSTTVFITKLGELDEQWHDTILVPNKD